MPDTHLDNEEMQLNGKSIRTLVQEPENATKLFKMALQIQIDTCNTSSINPYRERVDCFCDADYLKGE